MNGFTQNVCYRRIVDGLLVLILPIAGVLLALHPVYAQCRCRNGAEECIPCIPIIITVGGSGTIMPSPDSVTESIPEDLQIPEPETGGVLEQESSWVIDLQTLLPDRQLAAGDEVMVMLARERPGTDGKLMEPLILEDGRLAWYGITIGDDGATAIDLGKLAADAAGGTYAVFVLAQEVATPEEFWGVLNAQPEMAGLQRFTVKNLVALDQTGLSLADSERQINIPSTIDPAVLTGSNVQLQLNKNGQLLPQTTVIAHPTDATSVLNVYAPGQFLIDNVVAPVAPQLAPQLTGMLGSYFTPGEYQFDVLVNGVLESTQQFVIP